MVVMDDGIFDYVDPDSFVSVSHIRMRGLSKSSKTRLSQRGGHVAIADDNGFIFLKQVMAATPTL